MYCIYNFLRTSSNHRANGDYPPSTNSTQPYVEQQHKTHEILTTLFPYISTITGLLTILGISINTARLGK